MDEQHDIRIIAWAVVNGDVTRDHAERALWGRTEARPVCETLGLAAERLARLTTETRAGDFLDVPEAMRDECRETFRSLWPRKLPEAQLREAHILGRLLPALGIVSKPQVDECLDQLERFSAESIYEGSTPAHCLPRLEWLLIKKGYWPPKAAFSADPSGGKCESGLSKGQFFEMPDEVLEAAEQEETLFGRRYVKTRRLGKPSGMAQVWKAWDLQLRRWVALKFIQYPSGATPREMIERFHREARLAAKLKHPNIVTIFDDGEIDGEHFIAMEFVEGMTLDELPADAKRGLELLYVVGQAIEYAHQNGVFHRDLKPENVMIDQEGKPRVMDFGLARPAKDIGTVLTTGVFGWFTPYYAPPEQAAGSRGDARSDIYSLGAILYQLASGKMPFEGMPAAEWQRRVSTEDPVPLRKHNRAIERDVETIVTKAMRRKPSDRYASAKEFADDCRHYLDCKPIVARPEALVPKALRWTSRHPVISASGAGAALAAVVVSAVLGRKLWVEAQRRHKAEQMEIEGKRESDAITELEAHLGQLPPNAEGWTRGLALIDSRIHQFPRSARLFMAKAERCERLGRYQEAVESYEEAWNLNQMLATAKFKKGWVLLYHMKRVEEARKEIQLSLQTDPNHEFSKAALGLIAALDGDYNRAISLCDEAEAFGKHQALPFHIKAWILTEQMNKPSEGFDQFGEAIKREPHFAPPYCNQGVIRQAEADGLLRDGQIANSVAKRKEAVELFSKAIEIQENFPEAHYNIAVAFTALGSQYASNGDLNEALPLWEKSIEHCSRTLDLGYADKAAALTLQGQCKVKLGVAFYQAEDRNKAGKLLDEASAALSKAISVKPESFQAYYQRAIIRALRNDREGAKADVQQCLTLSPKEWSDRNAAETLLRKLDSTP